MILFLFILFFILFVISLILNIVLINKGVQAGKQLTAYDMFFNSTLEDVQEVLEYLNKLMKRELVSQDPDVKNLKKTIVILRDVLVGYIVIVHLL